jgi:hypothetical protein
VKLLCAVPFLAAILEGLLCSVSATWEAFAFLAPGKNTFRDLDHISPGKDCHCPPVTDAPGTGFPHGKPAPGTRRAEGKNMKGKD